VLALSVRDERVFPLKEVLLIIKIVLIGVLLTPRKELFRALIIVLCVTLAVQHCRGLELYVSTPTNVGLVLILLSGWLTVLML